MKLDTARGRVTTRASGVVTHADLSEHLDREAEVRAAGHSELFDARGATTLLSSDQVRILVHRTDRLFHRGHWGPTAIVTDNDVCFGMARMYEMLAEPDGIPVGVFRSVAAAERWLARP